MKKYSPLIKKMSFYDLTATTIRHEPFNFSELKSQVVLIVNVASKCGATPQYTGLEQLYEKYRDSGLVVLGFPCNQFGSQEPGDESAIAEFCQSTFSIKFPLLSKIDVNGENTHPVYKYLKSNNPNDSGNIRWNFEKFLVDRNGNVVARKYTQDTPDKLESSIKELLEV
ncbi:7166_t:CDS:2 [Ambispora gerdemannii]|uniref:Glutathione peroxidase n=1 Tax=Ambispora gerdemannii TaxID=144530 RepID=A0A9N8YQJ7_9GLOM|nr:7166_t:CDS:2 [Ambispora gerdemannii]